MSTASVAADARRFGERLRVLSNATRTFAEASQSTAAVFDAVVHEIAEVLQCACALFLLEEDGDHFTTVSHHAPSPELLAALRTYVGEPGRRDVDAHPGIAHVVRTRTSFFVPELPSDVTRRVATNAHVFSGALVARSALVVALPVRGRIQGALGLSRHGAEARPFDADDLVLAEALGEHAGLALATARLFEDAARELAARERMASRLRFLAEASREFAEVTGDLERLQAVIAERLAATIGDLCAIRLLSADRTRLEGGAVAHADPDVVIEARSLMTLHPQRVGEGVMGRVASTGQALLIPSISPASFAASAQAEFSAFLLRLGVSSILMVPLSCQGEVVGVVILLRSGSEHPYTEEDQRLLQAVGDHAALAIANARSYAAERAARAEAVRAGQALAQSEAAHRLLFDESPLPLIVYDTRSLRILAANDAAADLYGYERAELVQLALAELVVKEAVPTIRQRVDALGAAPSGGAEPFRRKDGSILMVEYSSRGIAFQDAKARVAVLKDVTARHEAEEARVALARAEEQLRQLQKMEAVGRLAGGVAHDFNNLLSVILSYSDLVLGELPADSPSLLDVEEIRKAGARASALTRQLLMFSRQQIVEPKVLDLDEVLASVDRMLRRLLGEDVELVTVPTAGLGRILADRSSVEQVIVNLAINARDAMPAGGRLTIQTANVEVDVSPGGSIVARPEPRVMLSVSDDGVGMPLEIQARIFEPFFTTKEPGKGTGLGLSTVFGIVQQAGGTVWVESEPGQGATFKVFFPRVFEPLAPSPTPSTAPRRGTETVLLVEDHPAVRGVAKGILERHGYRVLVAAHAEEALRASGDHPGPIDLLLTDVVMPRMSGAELAQRIAADRPETVVLYMSGYTEDAVLRNGVQESEIALLPKPFTPESLTRKVREVLDARRA